MSRCARQPLTTRGPARRASREDGQRCRRLQAPYRTTAKPKRTRIHHLREMKERGERWPMLTAYDLYAAQIFDEAGIPVLLVGDSAGNNVYGYDNTIP